jgi:hypothetical protein
VSTRFEHEDALDAFRAGDRARLLQVLVEVWREGRTPELAELIDQVSKDVEGAVGPIPGKTREERGALWSALEKQRRIVDVPRLVAGVVDCLRRDAEERVRRMAGWAIDPRASKLLVALIARPPNGFVGGKAQRFWRSVTSWIAAIKDVRALPELERLAVEVRESTSGNLINAYLPGMLDAAIAELRRADVRPLDPSWAAAIAEMRVAPKTDASAEDLFEQVYRSPQDLELRAVLGDVLQSIGDPRGELIALQLASLDGRSTRQQKKREKELVAQHGRAWLGAIEPVIHKNGVKFEAGFVAKARAGVQDSRRSHAVIGKREWATVHTLDVEPWSGESVAALVGHEVMRSLRVLIGAHDSVFLIQRPLLVEILGLRYSDPSTVARIVECRCLPALRRLDLGASWIESDEFDIWSSDVGRNLRELAIQAAIDPLAWILAAQSVESSLLESIEVRASRHNPWGVFLTRDPERRFTVLRWFVGWPYEMASAVDDLLPILEQLPPELPTRMEIRLHANTRDPTREQLAGLQRALQRFPKLESIDLPSRG